MRKRFRGYLPVVIDIETSGLDSAKNALLEIAAVMTTMDKEGCIIPAARYHAHIVPFRGAEFDPKSMAFNKIDPDNPFRMAVSEQTMLNELFTQVKKCLKQERCERAILVGHNAWFDLLFLKAAVARSDSDKMPFHAFSAFDTATLSGLIYGQTVLAKAVKAARIDFDSNEAHSALYDAEKTAELFCVMVNTWKNLSEKAAIS